MDKFPEHPKQSENTVSVRGMTPAVEQTRQLLPPVKPLLPGSIEELEIEQETNHSNE